MRNTNVIALQEITGEELAANPAGKASPVKKAAVSSPGDKPPDQSAFQAAEAQHAARCGHFKHRIAELRRRIDETQDEILRLTQKRADARLVRFTSGTALAVVYDSAYICTA